MAMTGAGLDRAHSSHTHALGVLEFDRVLSLVAERATSDLGAAAVRRLAPRSVTAAAVEALAAVEEMKTFLLRNDGWAPGPIPDLTAALDRLVLAESVLDADSLMAARVLLTTSRTTRRELRNGAADLPRLTALASQLLRVRETEDRLARSFDDSGAVSDAASAELRAIRRDLRGRRAALVERLEKLARRLPERVRVPDASVTLRNGRYCVPIRREGRSSIGGIVHDESSSHQTLFVEPPGAIEAMNRIRELELAETREIERVLRVLTEDLRPRAEPLRSTLDALTEIDSLFARGRYALVHGGASPELVETPRHGGYCIVAGRHPLLAASEAGAVPFDLSLAEEERLLLVSGPNAGGKTVLLKAIGLLSAMAQSGIAPPVGRGTRLPVFRGFHAVIGDEQSIEASLSTFSARMVNLKTILQEVDAHSLVLIDEVGGATDPAEGSALASAILARLVDRAALTVATTHLGDLKALAGETPSIVNGSLQFDAEALRPTFILARDRPGRSYALEIAERLGLPADVLAEARTRMTESTKSLDSLLADLEKREAELDGLVASARRRAADLERRTSELSTREESLLERDRELERVARKAEEKYLHEARRRVEEAIADMKERYDLAIARAGSTAQVEEPDEGPVRDAASAARSEVERALREARLRTSSESRPTAAQIEDIRAGDRVRVRGSDRSGIVEEVRGDRIVVRAEGLRLKLPVSEVELAPEAESSSSSGRVPESQAGFQAEFHPEIQARPEVDLRGLRVEEVAAALTPALDAAIFADLPRLRIIHGKGTGALRKYVSELLQADGRVPGFRPGEFEEGGSGVTVVEFETGQQGDV
jgi:DNA mismatch repair protein MutS2